MEQDTPAPAPVATPAPAALTPRALSRTTLRLGLFAVLALTALAGGYYILQSSATNGLAKDGDDKKPAPVIFNGWEKPDLVLVFSGQAHGYLQPCGCSRPQYGGLARRYNFIESLRKKGWPVLPVDLGDIINMDDPHDRPHSLLKYRTHMRALEVMGYRAVSLGLNEFTAPLAVALGQHTLDNPKPRMIATNLEKTDTGGLWHEMHVRSHEVIKTDKFAVGVLSIVGNTVAKKIGEKLPPGPDKADIVFRDPRKALADGLAELGKEKVEIGILLFHGDDKEAADMATHAHNLFTAARAKGNTSMPRLHAIVYLDDATDPPQFPLKVDGIPTQIISVGQKGKSVGALGLFRHPKHLEMRYQLVGVGEEYQPKVSDATSNPALVLMERYAKELKDKNILGKFKHRGLHPVQFARPGAWYVGSERCGDCHEAAHDVWAASAHSHAFKTLEDARFPANRQFDGECIRCHTTGFEYKEGYFDPPADSDAKRIAKHNFKLRDVGCESCHGPGSDHANDSDNKAIYPLINPLAAHHNPGMADSVRLQKIDFFCQKCHDQENDVNWGKDGHTFMDKWFKKGIVHPTRGKGPVAAPPAGKEAIPMPFIPFAPLPKAPVIEAPRKE